MAQAIDIPRLTAHTGPLRGPFLVVATVVAGRLLPFAVGVFPLFLLVHGVFGWLRHDAVDLGRRRSGERPGCLADSSSYPFIACVVVDYMMTGSRYGSML